MVDESELMRDSRYSKNGKIAFERVNDQIVSYLQKMSQSKSSSVARAGYIAIGMDFANPSRKAARVVAAVNSDLNVVMQAINQAKHQDIALLWPQIMNSLPGLITESRSSLVLFKIPFKLFHDCLDFKK